MVDNMLLAKHAVLLTRTGQKRNSSYVYWTVTRFVTNPFTGREDELSKIEIVLRQGLERMIFCFSGDLSSGVWVARARARSV